MLNIEGLKVVDTEEYTYIEGMGVAKKEGSYED